MVGVGFGLGMRNAHDALADGFLLNATGPHTLRFLPPLICTEAEASALADYLEGVLGA